MMPQLPVTSQRGFTLIEILVAIVVFAVLSMLAYTTLDNAVRQKGIAEQQANDLRRLQVSLLSLERDLQQAVERPVSAGLNQEDALGFFTTEPQALILTRTGHSNPLGQPRGVLQRVAYVFKDGQLIRSSWTHADRLQGEEAYESVLLPELEAWSWRFMDLSRSWQATWPPRNAEGVVTEVLPLAVELKLKLQPWGEVRRLIKVRGG